MTNSMSSVHLMDFPNLENISVNYDIISAMDKVRDICGAVLSIRKEVGIRVRMPIKDVRIFLAQGETLKPEFVDIIKDEVNAKDVYLLFSGQEEFAKKDIEVDLKLCGKKFGPMLKNILNARANGEWSFVSDSEINIANVVLKSPEFSIKYIPNTVSHAVRLCADGRTLVVVDTEVNNDIYIEGLARDLIRYIQQTRKISNCNITDRVDVSCYHNAELSDVISSVKSLWLEYIMSQTLSSSLNFICEEHDGGDCHSYELDGSEIFIKINNI